MSVGKLGRRGFLGMGMGAFVVGLGIGKSGAAAARRGGLVRAGNRIGKSSFAGIDGSGWPDQMGEEVTEEAFATAIRQMGEIGMECMRIETKRICLYSLTMNRMHWSKTQEEARLEEIEMAGIVMAGVATMIDAAVLKLLQGNATDIRVRWERVYDPVEDPEMRMGRFVVTGFRLTDWRHPAHLLRLSHEPEVGRRPYTEEEMQNCPKDERFAAESHAAHQIGETIKKELGIS